MRTLTVSLAALLCSLLVACGSARDPHDGTMHGSPHADAGAPSSGYGTTMATAVEVCKPDGERKYLRRLRCPDGSVPTFQRSGSGSSRTVPPEELDPDQRMELVFADRPLAPGEPDYHIVDYYDVRCGNTVTEVVMDMYHCHQAEPTEAPRGFSIVPPG